MEAEQIQQLDYTVREAAFLKDHLSIEQLSFLYMTLCVKILQASSLLKIRNP